MKYKYRAAILILFLVQIILVGFLHFIAVDENKSKYAQNKKNGVKFTSAPQFDNLHHKETVILSEKAELREDNIEDDKYAQKNSNGVKHLPGLQFDHLHHEEYMKVNVNAALEDDNIRDVKESLRDHYVIMPEKLGRLGNWMFQYAASYGIARTLNYKCVINSSHPLTYSFELPHQTKVVMDNVMVVNESHWNNKTWRETTDYMSHNLTIYGYYQRFKYFHNISKEIRNLFTIKPAYLSQAESFLKENTPDNKTLIGIHARRGDFLRLHAFHRGKLAGDAKFFLKAMTYYRRLYSNAIFVVVSDDHEWCWENIVGSDVRYSNFTKAIIDLAIMSLCDHTIITAGTFSWWAGWLAGGTVVYLADYPRPGSHVELNIIGSREEYYYPEWIGMYNG